MTMEETKDIITLEDIKKFVDAFYEKARQDELLAPIFDARIQGRWPEHLEKMYAFWETVLLGERSYSGSPFPPHAQLPIHAAHFERWIQLFITTIDESFQGEKAKEAKWRAARMAEMFQSKLSYYRKQGFRHLT